MSTLHHQEEPQESRQDTLPALPLDEALDAEEARLRAELQAIQTRRRKVWERTAQRDPDGRTLLDGLEADRAWRVERKAEWERRVSRLCWPRRALLGAAKVLLPGSLLLVVVGALAQEAYPAADTLTALAWRVLAGTFLASVIVGPILDHFTQEAYQRLRTLAESESIELDPLPPWP